MSFDMKEVRTEPSTEDGDASPDDSDIEVSMPSQQKNETRRIRRVLLISLFIFIIASILIVSVRVSHSHSLSSVRHQEDWIGNSSTSEKSPVQAPISTMYPSIHPANGTGNEDKHIYDDDTDPGNIYDGQGLVDSPSSAPSRRPSLAPSEAPLQTLSPSSLPTPLQTDLPQSSIDETGAATFYVIGDVPYNSGQAIGLRQQMGNIRADAEFLVHVGDLRNAAPNLPCRKVDYTSVAESLRLSRAPVFVLLGDNDWNDCPNPEQGLAFWKSEFLQFESKYWNHTFNIQRQAGRPETFSFRWKGTLFIGLNLVGGAVLNTTEWTSRLTSQCNWVKELVTSYTASLDVIGRIVIFGHATPTADHNAFFIPLWKFINGELGNHIPILYVNGDGHHWKYQPSFFNQASFLRIMVTGGSSEPPLRIVVDANGNSMATSNAFLYNRFL